MSRPSDLQLDSAPAFVRAERRVQRAGIMVITLIVIFGALGGAGQGILSTATARAGNLEVGYERFARQSFRTEIRVVTRAAGETARIAFDRSFLDNVAIEETRPRQLPLEEDGDRAVFVVPVDQGEARLTLAIQPLHSGVQRSRVSVEGGSAVELRQFVYF